MYFDATFGQGAAWTASTPATHNQNQPINPIFGDPVAPAECPQSEVTRNKGTWLDPALNIRKPEGRTLTSEIMNLMAEVEDRKRKLKPVDARNRYALVRAILANGLRCHFFRHPHLVAYWRRTESYSTGPKWLNGAAMAAAVDLMARADLLISHIGKRKYASTYQVTDKLLSVAHECGVTEHSLNLPLPRERLIRLREGNSRTPYIPFEANEETLRWTAQLEAYNAFIGQQDIALALSEAEQAEWVRHWNEDRLDHLGASTVALTRPEIFRTDLYRQFNNGSFDQGGRLYGGWWINAPRWLRKRITINEQPTVELDYSGCHIRMLYHQRGIDYIGDPYQLDELTACADENGLPEGYFRDGVKQLVQALINGNPGGKPEQAKIRGFSFKPYFTRPQLRQMIEEKHAPIANAFGTGAGLRLQRLDSDIALAIITRLQAQGVPTLPIHDSFIVPADQERRLRRIMEVGYKSNFKFKPTIKA